MNQKEEVAKIFLSNEHSFQEFINNTETFKTINLNMHHKIAEDIFDSTKFNGIEKWKNKESYKQLFMEMVKYPWDRSFIVNYVAKRKLQKDPTGFIT